MSVLTESDPRTYAIVGAAIEVHQQLGCGFLEPVYQEALAIELANRTIPFHREEKFTINYKGGVLETFYRPDFICFDTVIVELKALGRLSSIEESQVINYLKVTGYHTGLLFNFGNRSFGATTVCIVVNHSSADYAESGSSRRQVLACCLDLNLCNLRNLRMMTYC